MCIRDSDYVVELPDGTRLTRDPDNGAYMAALPFGSTEAVATNAPR